MAALDKIPSAYWIRVSSISISGLSEIPFEHHNLITETMEPQGFNSLVRCRGTGLRLGYHAWDMIYRLSSGVISPHSPVSSTHATGRLIIWRICTGNLTSIWPYLVKSIRRDTKHCVNTELFPPRASPTYAQSPSSIRMEPTRDPRLEYCRVIPITRLLISVPALAIWNRN